MFKNGVELLAEACRTDSSAIDNAEISAVIREAETTLTSTMDLAEDIPMTPDMIPVTKKGDKYYVDFTSVYAAAHDMNADIGNIMQAIINVNSDGGENLITPKNLILTVESADYFEELIAEAKCGGKLGEKAKEKLAKATNTIKAMKKAGINVVKKKKK